MVENITVAVWAVAIIIGLVALKGWALMLAVGVLFHEGLIGGTLGFGTSTLVAVLISAAISTSVGATGKG